MRFDGKSSGILQRSVLRLFCRVLRVQTCRLSVCLPSHTLAFEPDVLLEQRNTLNSGCRHYEYQWCFRYISNFKPFDSKPKTIFTKPRRLLNGILQNSSNLFNTKYVLTKKFLGDFFTYQSRFRNDR